MGFGIVRNPRLGNNTAPAWISVPTTMTAGDTIQLVSDYVLDINNDGLTITSSGNALPSGVSIVGTQLLCAGGASGGQFPGIQLQANDGKGGVSTSPFFTLTIAQNFQFNAPATLNLAQSSSKSLVAYLTGGTAPYINFSIVSGAISGVSLSSGGLLAATNVAVASTANFVFRAEDVFGASATSGTVAVTVVVSNAIPTVLPLLPALIENFGTGVGGGAVRWASVFQDKAGRIISSTDEAGSVGGVSPGHGEINNSVRWIDPVTLTTGLVVDRLSDVPATQTTAGLHAALTYCTSYDNHVQMVLRSDNKFYWGVDDAGGAGAILNIDTGQWEYGLAPLAEDAGAYLRNAASTGIGSGQRYNPLTAWCDALDIGVLFSGNSGGTNGWTKDVVIIKRNTSYPATQTQPWTAVTVSTPNLPGFAYSRDNCVCVGPYCYLGGGYRFVRALVTAPIGATQIQFNSADMQLGTDVERIVGDQFQNGSIYHTITAVLSNNTYNFTPALSTAIPAGVAPLMWEYRFYKVDLRTLEGTQVVTRMADFPRDTGNLPARNDGYTATVYDSRRGRLVHIGHGVYTYDIINNVWQTVTPAGWVGMAYVNAVYDYATDTIFYRGSNLNSSGGDIAGTSQPKQWRRMQFTDTGTSMWSLLNVGADTQNPFAGINKHVAWAWNPVRKRVYTISGDGIANADISTYNQPTTSGSYLVPGSGRRYQANDGLREDMYSIDPYGTSGWRLEHPYFPTNVGGQPEDKPGLCCQTGFSWDPVNNWFWAFPTGLFYRSNDGGSSVGLWIDQRLDTGAVDPWARGKYTLLNAGNAPVLVTDPVHGNYYFSAYNADNFRVESDGTYSWVPSASGQQGTWTRRTNNYMTCREASGGGNEFVIPGFLTKSGNAYVSCPSIQTQRAAFWSDVDIKTRRCYAMGGGGLIYAFNIDTLGFEVYYNFRRQQGAHVGGYNTIYSASAPARVVGDNVYFVCPFTHDRGPDAGGVYSGGGLFRVYLPTMLPTLSGIIGQYGLTDAAYNSATGWQVYELPWSIQQNGTGAGGPEDTGLIQVHTRLLITASYYGWVQKDPGMATQIQKVVIFDTITKRFITPPAMQNETGVAATYFNGGSGTLHDMSGNAWVGLPDSGEAMFGLTSTPLLPNSNRKYVKARVF